MNPLNYFAWYRRIIGGRWAVVTNPGIVFNYRWVRVSDACVERVDEEHHVYRSFRGMNPRGWIKGLIPLMIAAAVMAVGIPSTIVNLTFQAQPDPLLMGGMSPNDYATNFELVVLGSTDCTVPTNQWPVLLAVPATQFTNQGPFGSDWTVSVPTTANPTFFFLQFTNFNTSGAAQGRGPFSSVVAWVSGSPPGKLKKVQ